MNTVDGSSSYTLASLSRPCLRSSRRSRPTRFRRRTTWGPTATAITATIARWPTFPARSAVRGPPPRTPRSDTWTTGAKGRRRTSPAPTPAKANAWFAYAPFDQRYARRLTSCVQTDNYWGLAKGPVHRWHRDRRPGLELSARWPSPDQPVVVAVGAVRSTARQIQPGRQPQLRVDRDRAARR